MCSILCLKVSLLVFLSISLVFSQIQILAFMLLSYWLSLILALILFTIVFTLAYYGTLADSYIALYFYIGLQATSWILEGILLVTVGVHLIGLENEKTVLYRNELLKHKYVREKTLPLRNSTGQQYSAADFLENYLKYYSHIPITCNGSNRKKSKYLIPVNVEYQSSKECQITFLAWITIIRDIYDLIAVFLAIAYACVLHGKKENNIQDALPPVRNAALKDSRMLVKIERKSTPNGDTPNPE